MRFPIYIIKLCGNLGVSKFNISRQESNSMEIYMTSYANTTDISFEHDSLDETAAY